MYGFVLSSLRRVRRDGGLAERGVVPSGCIWLVLSADHTYPRRMAHRHAEYEIFYHMHSKIPSEISDSTVSALRGFCVSRNGD